MPTKCDCCGKLHPTPGTPAYLGMGFIGKDHIHLNFCESCYSRIKETVIKEVKTLANL